ncbi:hypothetical protein A7C99_5539 [Trichophyton rubrum]|uniref:Cytochrome P450 monooxygenase n=1 Tax=Trichophyton rubrum TaxID=5551 RepID=A0A178ESW7_TRIRU|nr:hypothetical protein A7C99_5539 [Trichophyton rubrum]
MASIGSLSVSDLINHTIPYQITALSIGLLVVLILLIDHADILLRSWHVRGLYCVTSQTLFKTRFRKKLSGAELENALQYAYDNYTKQGKPFATKADLESWIILLPSKAMKEWCNLPYSHLNFTRYLQDVAAMGYHTQVDCQTHLRTVMAYNQKKHFVLGPKFSRDQELMAQITSHVMALLRSGESAADDLTMLTVFLKQALKDGLLTKEQSPSDDMQFESLSMKSLFHIYEVWGPIVPLLIALLSRIMDSPEYVEDLREEVSGALASADGWDSDFLANTPKLESFTRETLRLNVAISVSVSRVLHAPLKLKSVDIDLPKGSYIGLPCKFMHTDPELYPDPLTFDRYRFYDKASNTSTARATTASETFLPFGYGASLCPGRFIGVKAAQVLFSRFLLEYDVQFLSKGQKFAPMVLLENTWTYPEMDVMAKVRRRQPKSP